MMARSIGAPFKCLMQNQKILSLQCSFRLPTHGPVYAKVPRHGTGSCWRAVAFRERPPKTNVYARAHRHSRAASALLQ
jgi:hypothetical protein